MWVWQIAFVTALAACGLEADLVACGDEICPAGDVCTAGGCARPAEVTACDGLAEGAVCIDTSDVMGTCEGGACRIGLCGNGRLDPGELCDDGNQVAGDGCSADCKKIEKCGDGVVDPGEACDDGNTNAADGCDACVATQWQVSVVVGAGLSAAGSAFNIPQGIAVGRDGRIYIADQFNYRVRRIDTDGTITTVAGTGTGGFSGDGGAATSAQLLFPSDVAVDGLGRIYIADAGNNRIRRVDVDGTISTVAGNNALQGFGGDGGQAIQARLASPSGVAVDGLGQIYIADTVNHRIRRIDTTSTITTIAGTGTAGSTGDHGPATAAQLNGPMDVALDATGRVYVADSQSNRIRRIDLTGTITTVAGGGAVLGDGGPATSAELAQPTSVAVDDAGAFVISDAADDRIRYVNTAGTITTIAGTGVYGDGGDGGPATAATMNDPYGVAFEADGSVLITDDQRVRHFMIGGTITTVAGTGIAGAEASSGVAIATSLYQPSGVAIDGMGRVVISDSANSRVLRAEPDGTITTLAGTGELGFSGDGGPATMAQLSNPVGLAFDPQGRLVIADTNNNRVRRIELDGTIGTIAGINGTVGPSGDGGPATSAGVPAPWSLAIDSAGRIFILEFGFHAVRRVDVNGTISTVAGTGVAGYNGDGGAATAAQLNWPWQLAVDSTGRLVIADSQNERIRRVAANGTISTIAGTGTLGLSGDGGPATSARIDNPEGVAIDPTDRVVITDTGNACIRRIETNGTMSRPVGSCTRGAAGDGGPASGAWLNQPTAVTATASQIAFVDPSSSLVRLVTGGTIDTVAGPIDPLTIGLVAQARLDDPQALFVTPDITFVAGGTSGRIEAIANGRVEVLAGNYPQDQATGNLARYRSRTFGAVGGVAFDAMTGLVYATETGTNSVYAITRVDPENPKTWTIAPLVSSTGTAGLVNGVALAAQLRAPTGLWLDGRVLYIVDTGNHAIRALDLQTSMVTTIANGGGDLGYDGDGGAASAALLFEPTAIARCGNGDLFIADTGNYRVRRIDAGGTITTVLGDGVAASSGEGTPARDFSVDTPHALACDAFGNLYVTSSTTVRMLPASDAGIVDGTGPVQTIYGRTPRDRFPTSATRCLAGLAVIGASTLQVADACTGLLVQLDRVSVQ